MKPKRPCRTIKDSGRSGSFPRAVIARAARELVGKRKPAAAKRPYRTIKFSERLGSVGHEAATTAVRKVMADGKNPRPKRGGTRR